MAADSGRWAPGTDDTDPTASAEPVTDRDMEPATESERSGEDGTVTGTDGRRYWLPPVGADGSRLGPPRRGNSLNWLIGAGLLVLVTLIVGVFVLGHALDGISTSRQAQVVDDYASALARNDATAAAGLACAVDRNEVASATQALLTGPRASSAERRGALHRDSDDTEHATVRLGRSGAAAIDVTVAIARVSGSWCLVSVAPQA